MLILSVTAYAGCESTEKTFCHQDMVARHGARGKCRRPCRTQRVFLPAKKTRVSLSCVKAMQDSKPPGTEGNIGKNEFHLECVRPALVQAEQEELPQASDYHPKV